MFDFLFGWRKASKCKRLIRRVQCRLKLLKNKRYSIVRLLREDVAQLIKTGHEEVAIDRAEQLFKDECIMAVYELLDHFCEFILIHLSYIRRNRDCPNDVNEAVSSLIFASARCGDLPELLAIRKLFGERYGDSFTKGALQLYPGNLVNREIRDKLSIKSVSEEVKLRLVDEISRDYCLRPEVLALEYASELQKQMKEIMEQHVTDANAQLFPNGMEESKLQDLNPESVETKPVLVDSIGTGKELVMAPVVSSLDSDKSQSKVTLQRASERKKNIAVISSSSSSSSRNSPQLYPENVVFLDDVEEVQTSLKVHTNYLEQRLFKFKSSPVPRIDAPEEGYLEESDSWDVRVSKASRKIKTGPEKRIRRPISRDKQCLESTEIATYYTGPKKNPNYKSRPNQQKNKHQEDTAYTSNQSSRSEKRPERAAKHSVEVCCKVKDCSLESPCYSHIFHKQKIPLKQERISSENLAVVYDAFTYVSYKPSIRNTEMERAECQFSASEMDSSSGGDDGGHGLPPYVRAMTMPPQSRKEIQSEKIPRSNSCPFQYPNHVHPKLPDYDEIAAKFSALKKECLQKKDQCNRKQEVH